MTKLWWYFYKQLNQWKKCSCSTLLNTDEFFKMSSHCFCPDLSLSGCARTSNNPNQYIDRRRRHYGCFGSFWRYVDVTAILEKSRLPREQTQVKEGAAVLMDKKQYNWYHNWFQWVIFLSMGLWTQSVSSYIKSGQLDCTCCWTLQRGGLTL